MKRTTIMADDDLLREMQHLAVRQGTTLTAVLHAAMRTYLEAQRSSTITALAGIATTPGPADYSDGRDEEILASEAHPVYGLASDTAEPGH